MKPPTSPELLGSLRAPRGARRARRPVPDRAHRGLDAGAARLEDGHPIGRQPQRQPGRRGVRGAGPVRRPRQAGRAGPGGGGEALLSDRKRRPGRADRHGLRRDGRGAARGPDAESSSGDLRWRSGGPGAGRQRRDLRPRPAAGRGPRRIPPAGAVSRRLPVRRGRPRLQPGVPRRRAGPGVAGGGRHPLLGDRSGGARVGPPAGTGEAALSRAAGQPAQGAAGARGARKARAPLAEAPFFAPVGVPIGADSPAEIAVSILAEIIGVRSGKLQPAPHDPAAAPQPA